jgi:transcriptional regulator with XRE-family HTH domain
VPISGSRAGVPAVERKIGSNIRARRTEIGMSQTELADALGVTFQSVQKYEKGQSRVACSRLLQIAETLKTPVSKLFVGLGKYAV